jgi:uncharacterized protein (TIGR04255 family)
MKHAPLIYTAGMVKFPRVPDFERFINEFMELIRKDYPLDDQFVAQIFDAQISPDGIKMEPQSTKLWQFSSIDRKWAFVLNEQTFFLHTADYHDFAAFAKRFRVGIATLSKVKKIDIQWMTSIGIRYVNMISPSHGMNLKECLNSWVLPLGPPDNSLKIIQGIHAVRYRTEHGELRLQSLHNPTFTLPPELNTPFIGKNGWIKKKPTTDFALIDIDHRTTWENPLNFSESTAHDVLSELRKSARMVFDSIGTPKVTKIWEGK